ncbi:hypothetical protein A6R68_22075, partial [Neotoma lepida]
MSHESFHKFSKVLLTSFLILLLLLKILFSIALISKDWKPFSSHCYFTVNDFTSWSESEEKCSSMGAHLMVIHSQEEQVHPGRECVLGLACCLPLFTKREFCDMGVGDVADGFPSGSWKGCFSLGILHLAPASDFITQILNPKAAYYIGLSDPGHRQWRWVDQTPYNESVTFWHPGEPNNDNEQCVVVNHPRFSWGWNDVHCSAKEKSVCQMN